MAQIVDYHDKDVKFTQGPFIVVTNIPKNSCRIEAEHKGVTWPVLPDPSIAYKIQNKYNLIPGSFPASPSNHERLINIVDWLNLEVFRGNIVLESNVWIAREKSKMKLDK